MPGGGWDIGFSFIDVKDSDLAGITIFGVAFESVQISSMLFVYVV